MITVHWLDKNFHLHEVLLSFKKLGGKYTGLALPATVLNILKRYSIIEKLFYITVDNAKNNDNMISDLSLLLLQQYGIIWNPETYHIRCLNYIINRAIDTFLKKIKTMKVDPNESYKETEEDEDEDNTDEKMKMMFLRSKRV